MASKMKEKKNAQQSAGKAEKPKEGARFGELDQYLFGQATHYQLYKKMGAHPDKKKGEEGVWFTVWAPNAAAVSVIGAFNNWEGDASPMEKVTDGGVYELFIPGAREGQLYKYRITAQDGRLLYKADPYAFSSEKRPGNASQVAEPGGYQWGDVAWLKKREEFIPETSPMSVYEVHPGSWKKHPWSEENPDGFYDYVYLAKSLTEYVRDMGYTHVELMGIAEHPLDASWGYQVTGYYAPTSRYGTPKQFKFLVDYLHKNKIGVILDWVPAHFPKDAHGLAEFDGTAVYEYGDPKMGELPDWGTKIFNYGRAEVKNFMLANALYWVEEYHIDALRVDAVASMLYLDYGKKDGEWIPNKYGGHENLEAVEFFKHLNSLVTGRNKGVAMIAEESTAWPNVTKDVHEDGLGFTFKWNMGWMHDFLEYMKQDPYFRKHSHGQMTFSLSYAFSENYILALSHDEVVHLKCSMLSKMPGLLDDKFKNLMAGYSFMFGHPGKKLLFMGQDFGQLQEWSETRELDWYLLAEKQHEHLQAYVRDLLKMYARYPALYGNDSGYEGFEWVNANDCERSIFSFIRHSPSGRDNLLFVCSFTPVPRPDYRVGVPRRKQYRLILDSFDGKYGGKSTDRQKIYHAVKKECDGKEFSIGYDLPAYGVAVFSF